ncbi:MAG: hypothetical protein GX856_00490 [Gammaproteobacteria bacterium]|jgi:hypothetical protein|nr:hypothetical protein [Gammaproteobacteria bacterium]
MGTRHLIAVQHNGEYKIAQYGQWDGYPSGQGADVLDFLRRADLERFKAQVDKTGWITDAELEDRWVEAGAVRGSETVTLEVSNRMRDLYPELSRDTGAKVLDIVYKADGGLQLRNSIEFAQNSLFCEWAYVIDLDAPASCRCRATPATGRRWPTPCCLRWVSTASSWRLAWSK